MWCLNVACVQVVVRRRRLQLGVKPCVKQIDTLAAEFPAQTNYLYMTYSGIEDDLGPQPDGVMVLVSARGQGGQVTAVAAYIVVLFLWGWWCCCW